MQDPVCFVSHQAKVQINNTATGVYLPAGFSFTLANSKEAIRKIQLFFFFLFSLDFGSGITSINYSLKDQAITP